MDKKTKNSDGQTSAAGLKGTLDTVSHKVHSLEELQKKCAEWRAEGQKIALCHGVFDVLHIGHLKHLEAARREADKLVVTITADAFVRKGPGRPHFTAEIRAEMLAGLEYVMAVAIVHDNSAIPAIQAAAPHVYVKGADYRDVASDVTGKIRDEMEAVEGIGGIFHYTDEIEYSSSTLINRIFADHNPVLRACLDQMRESDGLRRLEQTIDKIRDSRVLFIGDCIIDEYQFVSPLGRPAKENIVATLAEDREQYAGGIVAAAKHLSSFCRQVEIITVLGEQNDYSDFVNASMLENVSLYSIGVSDRPTTRKTRFVDHGSMRKLFEVYDMDDRPLDPADQKSLDALIESRLSEVDAVIVCDFGHGMIAPSTIRILEQKAPFLAINVQTNAGNQGYNRVNKFTRADLVCVDTPEARLAVSDKFKPIEDIVMEDLPSLIDCPLFIITHGKYGCYVGSRGASPTHIPAFTNQVVDTVGAGDCFYAVAGALASVGSDPNDLAFIANAAGALKVNVVGHRQSVDQASLRKYITSLLK